MGAITVIRGDLTTQVVDAIVNAAKPSLLGGGGVDGAVHRAAGPELLAACRDLESNAEGDRCPTGEARVTPGFNLPAKFVIHAVGPVFDPDDEQASKALLTAAHEACFQQALDTGCRTIAFPALSCGVYGYPPVKASEIAVATARRWFATHPEHLIEVRFVLFTDECYAAFLDAREHA